MIQLQWTKEEYDVIREKENIYMREHFKSLEREVIITDCTFRCGNLTLPNEDLCKSCTDNYSAYIMQQTMEVQQMVDEEKKDEESKPEGDDAEKKDDAE